MLTTIGAALILTGGFIVCVSLSIGTELKKTPEIKLQNSIDENNRRLAALEYELRESNRQ